MKDMKELLERYYDGETTTEEEALLRDYLAAHPGAADTASARLMTDLAGWDTPVPLSRKKYRLHPGWWGLTTAAAALAAIFIFRDTPPPHRPPGTLSPLALQLLADPAVQGEIKDEQVALEQARKALNYVSATLNKGIQGVQQLEKLDQSVDKIQNEQTL
ncbi:MAG: hypothetical protein JNL13_11315 [Chitinophagaceae bacterium]|nr:hypothetical protein [Chitinophagaceae bacterium]